MDAILIEKSSIFLLILARIYGLLMAMPIFSLSMLSSMIRLVIAAILAIFVISQEDLSFNHVNNVGLLAICVICELLFGVFIGLLMNLMFEVVRYFADIVAMQAGLGFAVMNQPGLSGNSPVLGQLYMNLSILMFLMYDGHLVVMRTIFESFSLFPQILFNFDFLPAISKYLTLMSFVMKTGFMMAIPYITILLLVNISLGVITKAAPQINIFSIGFPLLMISTFILLLLLIPYFSFHFHFVITEFLRIING